MYACLFSIVTAFFSDPYAIIAQLISHYGYSAIFVLMLFESSSLPVPSEVVLPLAGLLSSKGLLDFYLAFAAALAGSIGGLAVDYAIGYYLGKDLVYKHLRDFHIKKADLDAFDAWFGRNAVAAVFFSRLIPIARTIMSLPAGFVRMPLKQFFAYSILGSFIWDIVLMYFGFYLLSAKSAAIVLSSIGAFAIIVYLIYALFMRHIRMREKR
jgi:membrane protein DedA with SNARE-associated domain